MLKHKRPHRMIAPRLASEDCRDSMTHGLPPEIKEGLRAIAASENKSVSWVLETALIDYFGLKRPRYVPRKSEIIRKKARRLKQGGSRGGEE